MSAAPDEHFWVKIRGTRALWRCPWCGACRKKLGQYPPDRNAVSQPDAEAHYSMLTAEPRKPQLRKPPRKTGVAPRHRVV